MLRRGPLKSALMRRIAALPSPCHDPTRTRARGRLRGGRRRGDRAICIQRLGKKQIGEGVRGCGPRD